MKINYGIDAPGVIKKLIICSIILPIIYFLFFHFLSIQLQYPPFLTWAYFAAISTAIYMLATATFMLWSSKVGKLKQTDRLLSQISWQGDEHVLDVGCGRGLLVIKAAQKLIHGGKAIGIDIWSDTDLSQNSKSETLRNAQIAQVSDRIEIMDGDVRHLPFADNSFDIVVSSLVIHNLSSVHDRQIALDEMMRVIKPQGFLLLQDIFCTKEYFMYLKIKGFSKVELSDLQWLIFPPVRMIIVQKD